MKGARRWPDDWHVHGLLPTSVKSSPPSELLWPLQSVCTARRTLSWPRRWPPPLRSPPMSRELPAGLEDWLGSPLLLSVAICVPAEKQTDAGRTGAVGSRQTPEFAAH